MQITKGVHKVIFYEEELFFRGDKKANPPPQPNKVWGGVVPHHLLPGFIISDFFKRISSQKPKTIVLIGPNHHEKGNFPVLTSKYAWETPFGLVYPNEEKIDMLISKNLARADEEVIKNEHSVSGILPYIKYYLPNTKVIPLILSSKLDKGSTSKLSSEIVSLIDEDTIVIASVDFSHYLPRIEAEEKDKITLEVMKKFEYDRLFHLNNDYLDSPASIATLFQTMEGLDKKEFVVLYNTNSGLIERNDFIETTSYFSLVFY